jgi:hypothetical protein
MRFGRVFSRIAAATCVVLVAGCGVASATGSHSTAREEGGGVVRVHKHSTTAMMTITRESSWDVANKRPKCFRPPPGERAVDFDFNWLDPDRKARVPGATVTLRTSHRVPLKLGTRPGCHVIRHWHLTAEPPTTQTVYGLVAYLKGKQRLGRLRVTVDGHTVRLAMKPGCDLVSSSMPPCSPEPVIHDS